MPNAKSGVLITCDAAMKQFVLHVDEQQMSTHGDPTFVVEDLDETHLLVQPDKVELIQAKVMELQDQNAYSRDEAKPEEVAAAKKAKRDGAPAKKARREEEAHDVQARDAEILSQQRDG